MIDNIRRSDPKVAIILSTDKLSGAQNRAVKIFRALRERNYPVELWISEGLRPLVEDSYPDVAAEAFVYQWGSFFDRSLMRLSKLGPVYDLLDRIGLFAMLGMPTLERQLLDRDIAIAHIYLDMRLANVRACATLYELTSPDIASKVGNWPTRRLRSHSGYLAVSSSVERRFRQHTKEGRLSTAPLPFFQPTRPTFQTKIREKKVVFAHRFMPRKNGVLFAHAARLFCERNPEWRVDILGQGEDEDQIREIVAPMSSKIRVDYTNDLPTVLQSSQIFVSLISPDNYPSQSVFEAMANGNALLVSNTGDSADLLIDGNGAVVNLDINEVVKALELLIESPGRLLEMGEKSRAIMQTRYSADRYLDFLTQTYISMA